MEGRKTVGLAARDTTGFLSPYSFNLRKTGAEDVVLKVLCCGIDHRDLHQMRNEIHGTKYPLVPGHEVVGEVVELGSEVKKLKVGDKVGVGCIIWACGKCCSCKSNLEQYCSQKIFTVNGTYEDGTPTHGGFSSAMKMCLDYILDTVPALHPLRSYLPVLKINNIILCNIWKKNTSGSFIGSIIEETQEILEFQAEKGLTTMIEILRAGYVNEASERIERNDVRYRFVLDLDLAGSNLK
ncbi:probable cinnamyl alcohol dehydrogenase [Morus notabilis]|uniref:probable cinnamyl alcohol dehydrogenase n=1 Tax=Morus notabilis TaxID=981085 RepID=UPI000CED4676|nr:probable cinnamyl alcohol dehydrogenase [Morus notabilis]